MDLKIIKTERESLIADLEMKVANQNKVIDKLAKNIDYLNQSLSLLNEKIEESNLFDSKYASKWLFDPRLPYFTESMVLADFNESELEEDYAGRWISVEEFEINALLNTNSQLLLSVNVGQMHQSIEKMTLACYINNKLFPWTSVADGSFQTVLYAPGKLAPTSIKIKVKNLKRKADASEGPLYLLKNVTVESLG